MVHCSRQLTLWLSLGTVIVVVEEEEGEEEEGDVVEGGEVVEEVARVAEEAIGRISSVR